ncbi:MAG: glycosyltransferase family 4 protein [Planctomycetota bacterium]|jgi:glycosyltransferase involved in cell wall biosynthesis
MNILYHHRTLGDGAEGIHIKEMICAFEELGHKVKVVSPIGERTNIRTRKTTALSKIKSLIPGVFYEIMELLYNIYGFYALIKVAKSFKPDFIYDRYITYNASSILVGRKLEIPVILEVNSPIALERAHEKDERLYFKKIANYLEKWICKNSSKTIVVSTPLKKYLISIGVPEKKISVMPNGVNLKRFSPFSDKDKNLMKQLNIKENKFVIGFLGILRPWHGIDMILKSFRELYKVRKDIHLLIVGDGPIMDDIEREIRTYKITESVTMTGRVPHEEIPRYINIFDIAVSPKTTFYASPMKVLEYMALKKPVVAPDTDNIKDIISHNVDGLLFTKDDHNSLKETIMRLIDNRKEAVILGEKARQKVCSELNWSRNADIVIKYVEESRGLLI